MSGGGLCFLIRVPTEDYERDIVDSRRRTPPASTPTTGSKTDRSTDSTNETKDSSKDDETEVKTKIPDPLEKILRKSLEELRVFDALWILDKDERYYQVSFTCSPGLPSDIILTSLATNGIGMCRGSSLMVLPCTVWLQDDEDSTQDSKKSEAKLQFICDEDKKSDSDVSTLSKTKSEVKKAFRNFKDMQKKFLKTVTARLTVAQVVDGVRAGAEPTFDFIMFVLIASMIAALGLLENSSVIIVASMLISPIMGPILAGTFGAVVRDRSLRNLGIRTEIVGLFLCVSIGFLFGLSSEAINTVWGRREWPNLEMISRGQERSLWIGVLIALPSGAGVALSVLGGNAGSLVGVAISASLLPPAVNAGLLWGMATVRTVRAQDEDYQFVRVEGIMRLMKPSLVPSVNYGINYYPEMDKECALLGLVSLALTFINIVCIFLAALVVLKIKEVAPRTNMSKTSRFWKEDIKIARDYNASMPVSEAEEFGNQLLAEWATLNGLEPEELLSDDTEAAITRMETLKDIMQDVESDEVFQTVARSISNVSNPRPLSQRISVAPLSLSATTSPTGDRRSAVRSWLRSSLRPPENGTNGTAHTHLSPELKDVELRRPHPQNIGTLLPRRPSGSRSSVAVLRQSLMNADNPYTLWPSTSPESVNKVRFLVTPVSEEPVPPLAVPTSPTRRRVSKFLKDPCVILKETTC